MQFCSKYNINRQVLEPHRLASLGDRSDRLPPPTHPHPTPAIAIPLLSSGGLIGLMSPIPLIHSLLHSSSPLPPNAKPCHTTPKRSVGEQAKTAVAKEEYKDATRVEFSPQKMAHLENGVYYIRMIIII